MQSIVEFFFVFCSIIASYNNCGTRRKTYKKSYNQINHLSGGATYGSKRLRSYKTTYYNCVSSIVELLKQSSQHNREEEKQELFPYNTLCNLVYRSLFSLQ